MGSDGVIKELPELRIIDFSKGYFECQGRTFYIRREPGFARYKEMQKIFLEFTFNMSILELYNSITASMNYMNNLKFTDAVIIQHNLLHAIKQIEEKYDPSLRLCALFMDEQGEDQTVYDEAKMREKIDCWGKELAVTPFFQFAANLVPNWTTVYKKVFLSGSKDESVKV